MSRRIRRLGQGVRQWWNRLLNRPLWMLLPAGLALLAVVLAPVALSVWLSFAKIDAGTLRNWAHAPLVGLRNYTAAFTGPDPTGSSAGHSIMVSVGFSVLTTLVTTPVGVLAALSVHRRFRGSALVRAVYLVPYVIPTFVLGAFARVVFLNKYGAIDQLLSRLGLAGANTYWLVGPNAFWAMLMAEIWAAWPFIYLMTLAALQAIPKEHFEAAALDGAGYGWRLRKIVLPQISGMLWLAILLSTLLHFGNFTLAYVMFSSPPPASAAVLPIATYFRAFTSFDYGIASAVTVVTMAILIVPGYLYVRLTRLETRDQ